MWWIFINIQNRKTLKQKAHHLLPREGDGVRRWGKPPAPEWLWGMHTWQSQNHWKVPQCEVFSCVNCMTIKLSQIYLRRDILQQPPMMTVGSQTSPCVTGSREESPHCTWSGNLPRHLDSISCSWICYKLQVCIKQIITADHVSMCYNCYGNIFWSNIDCFKYSKHFNTKKMIFFHLIYLETLL